MRPFARVLSMIAMLVLTMQPAGASFRAERPDADPGFMTVQRSRSGGGGGFRSYSPPPRSYTQPPAPRTFAPAPRTFAPAPSRPQVFQTPSRPMPYMGQRPGGFAQPRSQFAQPRLPTVRPSIAPSWSRPGGARGFAQPDVRSGRALAIAPSAPPRLALTRPTLATGRSMVSSNTRPSVAARSAVLVGGAAAGAAWSASRAKASTSVAQTGTAQAGTQTGGASCTRMALDGSDRGVQLASREPATLTDVAPEAVPSSMLLAINCNGPNQLTVAFTKMAAGPEPRGKYADGWSARNPKFHMREAFGRAATNTPGRSPKDTIREAMKVARMNPSRDPGVKQWIESTSARTYLREARAFAESRPQLGAPKELADGHLQYRNQKGQVGEFSSDGKLVNYYREPLPPPSFDFNYDP